MGLVLQEAMGRGKQRRWEKKNRGRNTLFITKLGTFVSQPIGFTTARSPHFEIWAFLCWKCCPRIFPSSESCEGQYISTKVC